MSRFGIRRQILRWALVWVGLAATASRAQLITVPLGELEDGAAVTIEWLVTVANPVLAGATQVCNQGDVSGSNYDPDVPTDDPALGGPADPTCTQLTAQPDLTIVKSDGGISTVPGATVAYTLTYSNVGNQGATGVVLGETVPANTTFNAGASTAGWVCVPNGNAGSACSLAIGALAGGGAGGAATFAVTVDNPVPAGVAQISNTATIADDGTNGADPTPGNNSSTDTTPLVAQPDLTLAKGYAGPTPFPGDTIPFDLDYSNVGNQGATGVAITETVPANTTFNPGASTAGWACLPDNSAGSTCTLAVGGVAGGGAGGAAVFAVDLDDPLPPGVPEVDNCASVADDGANGADPNPGDNSDCLTVTLDSTPPTVIEVDTVPASPGGELTECETVTSWIGGFRAVFSEPMADPPGDSGAADVTNPANYLVVAAGPDFDFATTGCGGAAGDDVAVSISSVTYDTGTDTATLSLAAPLAAGQHRLFLCDELTDLAGNALDGDGDANAGGDFRRAFRSDPDNHFANGHFDCDLGGWTPEAAVPAEVTWSSADADDADDSGSVFLTNLAPGVDTLFGLGQCVEVVAGTAYELDVRVRLAAAPGVPIGFERRCRFYSSAACAGLLGTVADTLVLFDTGGLWSSLSRAVTPPAGSQSAACRFAFVTASGQSFDGGIDGARLSAGGAIFADGFETGDTSRWNGGCSGCVP